MNGVYIKGMEMPTSCWNCPFDKPLCTLWQGMTTDEMDNGRHKDCPLVPVPPHGRLIDADALIGLLGIMGDKCDNPVVWEQMRYIVEDVPTIIPADKEGEG